MTTVTKSKFDQIFEAMNAPDYPCTCDECGVEGTNASMMDHECDDEPMKIPCSQCGQPTTRDPIYGDLCYRCCRAENE